MHVRIPSEVSQGSYQKVVDYVATVLDLTRKENESSSIFHPKGLAEFFIKIERENYRGNNVCNLIFVIIDTSNLRKTVSIIGCGAFGLHDGNSYGGISLILPIHSDFTDMDTAPATEAKTLIDMTVIDFPHILNCLGRLSEFSHTVFFLIRYESKYVYDVKVTSSGTGLQYLSKTTRTVNITNLGTPAGKVKLYAPDGTKKTIKLIEEFESTMRGFLKDQTIKSQFLDNVEHSADRLIKICTGI